jgi:SpoVK/Ycf46/Vps4 family AAA+-type ATPase
MRSGESDELGLTFNIEPWKSVYMYLPPGLKKRLVVDGCGLNGMQTPDF